MLVKTLINKKITRNFWLYEFIEAQMNEEARTMIWDNIIQMNVVEFEVVAAPFAQFIRDLVNEKFKSDLNYNEIGCIITSGWRPKLWEFYRKRSGKSQHTKVAFDLQPTNVSQALAIEILAWLRDLFSPRDGGHIGGFAWKAPEYEDGKIIRIGFVHFDFRGIIARWEY